VSAGASTNCAKRARPRSESSTSDWFAEPRHRWVKGCASTNGSGISASSLVEQRRVLLLQRRQRVAAVAEDVEVGPSVARQ
jgi:hypothetical protein